MQAGEGGVIVYEKASLREESIILNTLRRLFKPGIVREFFNGKHILVARAKRLEVFLVTDRMLELIVKIKKVGREPYCTGVFIGILREKRGRLTFRPSLDVMERLFQKAKMNAVIVTAKAEQLVLYGRDVLVEGVLDILPPIREYTLIVNENLEVLALGKPIYKPEKWKVLDPKTPVVKNLIDKGWYLRRGG